MSNSNHRGDMNKFGRFGVFAFAAAVVSMTGCSSLNSKVGGVFNADTDLKLTLKADADINPDDKKRPSPLFLRLYELKSPKQFEKANFIDLFERDSEALGADLVAMQTLKRLRPGDERTDRFVLKPETRYVGVFAEFLQYRDAKFKILVPIAPTNVFASSAELHISGNRIGSTGSPADADDAAPARGTGKAGDTGKKLRNAKEMVDGAGETVDAINSAREVVQ